MIDAVDLRNRIHYRAEGRNTKVVADVEHNAQCNAVQTDNIPDRPLENRFVKIHFSIPLFCILVRLPSAWPETPRLSSAWVIRETNFSLSAAVMLLSS